MRFSPIRKPLFGTVRWINATTGVIRADGSGALHSFRVGSRPLAVGERVPYKINGAGVGVDVQRVPAEGDDAPQNHGSEAVI